MATTSVRADAPEAPDARARRFGATLNHEAIGDREGAQIERAYATPATPAAFIDGLWLLPSSWDRWAALFEEATLPKRMATLGLTDILVRER